MKRYDGFIMAQPGERYAYRPTCLVIETRGKYLGCGKYSFKAHGSDITDDDWKNAHEVLLHYPDGKSQWHFGPAAIGCCLESGDLEAIAVP